jgi:hypothetical protein
LDYFDSSFRAILPIRPKQEDKIAGSHLEETIVQDFFQRTNALGLPLRLLAIGLTLSGCMVEPARNPGAKAAEKLAQSRGAGNDGAIIARSSAVSVGDSSSRPSKLQSGLSLTLPKMMPTQVKQVLVTLDPMVALPEYDCSQGVASRVLDHQSGDYSTYILPSRGQDTLALNRYLERFDAKSKDLKLTDLAPGRYVLTVELLDTVNGTVFQRGQMEVVIAAGSFSAIKMDFENANTASSQGSLEIAMERPAVQGQESGSKHALTDPKPDADLAPYSSVCSAAELSSNEVGT